MTEPVRYAATRLGNVDNRYQMILGYPRTLCVCTGGLLRSPTLAWVLSNPPWNRNTRAAGSDIDCALVHANDLLLTWADEIVFVNPINAAQVAKRYKPRETQRVYVLDVPDHFAYRDPELVEGLAKELRRVGFPEGKR